MHASLKILAKNLIPLSLLVTGVGCGTAPSKLTALRSGRELLGSWKDATECAYVLQFQSNGTYSFTSRGGCVGGSHEGTYTGDSNTVRLTGINSSLPPEYSNVRYSCTYQVTRTTLALNCEEGGPTGTYNRQN